MESLLVRNAFASSNPNESLGVAGHFWKKPLQHRSATELSIIIQQIRLDPQHHATERGAFMANP